MSLAASPVALSGWAPSGMLMATIMSMACAVRAEALTLPSRVVLSLVGGSFSCFLVIVSHKRFCSVANNRAAQWIGAARINYV